MGVAWAGLGPKPPGFGYGNIGGTGVAAGEEGYSVEPSDHVDDFGNTPQHMGPQPIVGGGFTTDSFDYGMSPHGGTSPKIVPDVPWDVAIIPGVAPDQGGWQPPTIGPWTPPRIDFPGVDVPGVIGGVMPWAGFGSGVITGKGEGPIGEAGADIHQGGAAAIDAVKSPFDQVMGMFPMMMMMMMMKD